MQKTGRQILSAVFFICILGGLLVLSSAPAAATDDFKNQEPSNLHQSTSDCANNISADIGTAPREFTDRDSIVNNTTFTQSSIAAGDWLGVRLDGFESGSCFNGSFRPPGKNIGYAAPATPSANTTHTFALNVNQTIGNLQNVRIGYSYDGFARPVNHKVLTEQSVVVAGIDTNRDGIIDRDIDHHLSFVSVPATNTIYLVFDQEVTIPKSSFLILRYTDIRNPDMAGATSIEATVTGNTSVTDVGTFQFGPSQSGLFGNDLDVSIVDSKFPSRSILTLRGAKTTISDGDPTVYLPIPESSPTTSLQFQLSYQHNNEGAHMSSSSTQLSRKINITAANTLIFRNALVSDYGNETTVRISGYTSLAPNSRIYVQYIYDNHLVEGKTRVNESGFWAYKFRFKNTTHADELEYVLVYDSRYHQIGNAAFD